MKSDAKNFDHEISNVDREKLKFLIKKSID